MSRINLELFIARRIFSDKSNRKRFSQSIISVAVFGIAFGLLVMIVSVAVVTGFKKEVRNKVIGFGAHIQLVNFDSNSSYETMPVQENQTWLPQLKAMSGIEHVQVFATKPGIIKTDDEMLGMVLKGVGSDYDWTFFRQNLVEGSLPAYSDTGRSDQVLVSRQIASQLKLKTGGPLYCYFLNELSTAPRMRRFTISGIYQSSLEELDRLFVVADVNQIKRLNDWRDDQVSGFEIVITDFANMEPMADKIREATISYSEDGDAMLRPVTIADKYPQIFDWLNLLDMNVWIILTLIVLVAGFNMVSALLILILERTTMIGILKSVGSANHSIRKVFLYLSAMLIGRGLLWGNIAGVGFCLIQHYFGIFRLDPESYYLTTVPVNLKVLHLLALNIGTLLVTLVMLIVPSWYISKVSPDKAIRFD